MLSLSLSRSFIRFILITEFVKWEGTKLRLCVQTAFDARYLRFQKDRVTGDIDFTGEMKKVFNFDSARRGIRLDGKNNFLFSFSRTSTLFGIYI